ncbi:MAG TPA: hypothetical protein VHO03_16590 [Ignavibacteriales bacterium]|nr:hypothetical protein [Ignavibacteriales bacterium]
MKTDWTKPVAITNPFPVKVTGIHLPPKEDIPEEFLKHHNPYTALASKIFFGMASVDNLVFREGIDRKMAIQQILYCLNSFEPKHEYKEAGVGFLLSLWTIQKDK